VDAEINTHGWTWPLGKYRGERITRTPVGYLLWCVNVNHQFKDFAAAELKRRGTVVPTVEISGHAIDRASLNCRKVWHATSNPDEGIHAWLCRMSADALAKGAASEGSDKIRYAGLQFVFEHGEVCPTLKTVMPA